MQKENPHKVDQLRKKYTSLKDVDRNELVALYSVAIKFAPRVMSCETVLVSWLVWAVRAKEVDINQVRTLCMTERIHRELSA